MRTLILSCEHGGNDVPEEYESLFENADALKTHRGYDPGALELAKELAHNFRAPLFESTVTRLLVDLNRSLDNPTLYSEYTNDLPENEKSEMLDEFYFPYRHEIEDIIVEMMKYKKPVLHLSVHTFTPVLDNKERTADIGILFDPKHKMEDQFCDDWFLILNKLGPNFVTKKNYPYKGTADGLTTYLRSVYAEAYYLGIELEVNQKYPLDKPQEWLEIKKLITSSLQHTVSGFNL